MEEKDDENQMRQTLAHQQNAGQKILKCKPSLSVPIQIQNSYIRLQNIMHYYHELP